jgi:transposase
MPDEELDRREAEGIRIAAAMPLKRGQRGWIVPSQSGPGTYLVRPAPTTTFRVAQGIEPPSFGQPWICNCPDFQDRHLPCKHITAVDLVVRHEKFDMNNTILAVQKRPTYTQNWTPYNAAQCAEGDLIFPMLRDLCSHLSRPYAGRGRPRLPLSDMTYAAVAKVYSGLSARRFDSGIRAGKERGLTETDPHFNTVLRYLRDPAITPALEQLVTLSALPLTGVEQDFAMDSTGFSTCTYVRWHDHKWGKEQKKQGWIKLHATTGVVTNIITAVQVTPKERHDSPFFRPLLDTTAQMFPIREVSADKAYSSKANAQAVADIGATPFIPFKSSSIGVLGPQSSLFHVTNTPPGPKASAWTRMYHLFLYNSDTFQTHYHKRSNVEATFSMVKRKFGGSLRSKSEVGQHNEVLCKVIAHNLCVVISAVYELGLEMPTFHQSIPA